MQEYLFYGAHHIGFNIYMSKAKSNCLSDVQRPTKNEGNDRESPDLICRKKCIKEKEKSRNRSIPKNRNANSMRIPLAEENIVLV